MSEEFSDNLNTAVFTTKYVLEKRSPVLHVYHYNDDGAWQFSGEEDCDENDYRIISLEEMMEADRSISELANLPAGSCAKRKNVNSAWEIERIARKKNRPI